MKKLFLTLLLCLTTLSAAFATVVKSVPIEYKQSDGTTTTIIVYGDERVTWAKTTDGYTLLRADNDDYLYAIPNGYDGIKISTIIAHDPRNRTKEELALLSTLQKNLFYNKTQIELMKQFSAAREDYNKKINSVKAANGQTEDYKMVVILMSFNDYEFSTPQSDVNNLFNQVGYSKNGHPGSVHDYFDATSSGMLNLSATVVGPYVADSSIQYYGQSYTGEYNGQSYTINDLHVRDLIEEAVTKANNDVDFSQFTNGNGNYVSCVYVIFAGHPQSAGGNPSYLIWPHRSSLSSPMYVDGVYVSDYGCSSEFEGSTYYDSPMMIGTICHEFSHVLGQPDYYDTDYELHGNAFNPGEWDLMASGNYNGGGAFPPLWSAQERNVRGYVTIDIESINTDITLGELRKTARAVRLSYAGNNNEYFLLENRQNTGWDAYLPGHGMLIYHVDNSVSGWSSNCANCDTAYLGYELMTAGGSEHQRQWGSFVYDQSQPFPGSTNNTSFKDNTDPSSISNHGDLLSKPLYRIRENTTTGNITFHIGDTSSFVDIYDFTLDYTLDTINASALMSVNSLNVTEKGFVYSTSNTKPDTSCVKLQDINSSNTSISCIFTSSLLSSGETYYIRPYAMTANRVSYGEVIEVKVPCSSINIYPYNADFSEGQPACWTQEYGNFIANNWRFDSTGYAHTHTDGTTSQNIKLVTVPLNVTVLNQPMVRFSHYQPTNNGITDNLTIYYKTSYNGQWQILQSYTSNISSWKQDSILIPTKSKQLYIAFESSVRGGGGIYLKDVTITDQNINSWPIVSLDSVYYITDNNTTINANVISAGYTNLIQKGVVISENPNPTIDYMIFSSNSTNIGSFTINLNNLESSTTYYVRAFAQNGGMISYSNEKSFSTRCAKIKDFPYTPNLISDDTLCFVYSPMDNKLILPIFDLSYKDSMAIIYSVQNSSATSPIKLYFRNEVNGTWELINSTTPNNNTQITINLATTTNHQSPNAYIAFENANLSNLQYLSVQAVSQIAFVSTDTIFSPSYDSLTIQGSISYEGMTPVTQRGICYSTSNNQPTISDNKINLGSGAGIFTGYITNVEPLTKYYVRSFATNSYGTAYGETMEIITPFTPIFGNTISADQTLCSGSVPAQLNGSTPTGGNGTYSYLWISSTDSINWAPCDEGSVNTNRWYEPRQLFTTTYYRRIVTSYVSVDTTNAVTIQIYPTSAGGNAFRLVDEVKQNEPLRIELRAYRGSILYWERLQPGYDWQQVENSADSVTLTDIPTMVGEYSYRAVVKSGVCPSATSGEDVINVTENVGLTDTENSFEAYVSPNPTTGLIYLHADSKLLSKVASITITASNGKIVMKDTITLQENTALDLSKFNSGVYLITIQVDNTRLQKKIILTK